MRITAVLSVSPRVIGLDYKLSYRSNLFSKPQLWVCFVVSNVAYNFSLTIEKWLPWMSIGDKNLYSLQFCYLQKVIFYLSFWIFQLSPWVTNFMSLQNMDKISRILPCDSYGAHVPTMNVFPIFEWPLKRFSFLMGRDDIKLRCHEIYQLFNQTTNVTHSENYLISPWTR